MDRIISTMILVSVSVALAVALSTYYTGLVNVFMRYEEVSFDLAYAALRDGEAEIVLNFRNTGQGALTVVAIEINGADLEPTGNNPFPLELPYGTKARLRLHASPEIFVSGVAYEVAIRTGSGRVYSKMVVMP